jgi:ketosteroid isomerase-like protein
MPEESTTPDLVELTRVVFEAVGRRDFDAVLRFFAPDAVYDMSAMGTGTFEGHVAIRNLWEDWWGAYEEYESELEECQDRGNGVVFAVVRQDARPAGSTGRVQQRPAFVSEWAEGMIARTTVYYDIDEARAAAERLAEERG